MKFISTWDFSNLVSMTKGKLRAKYGGGINEPISRTLETLTRKGTERRELRKKGLENYFHNIMASKLSYSIRFHMGKH